MTDAEMEALVRAGIQASIDAKRGLLDDLGPTLAVARVLVEAYRRGGTMFVFGNGGSAADAQHIAGEFVSRFAFDRPGLPAIALTTDTSILTAIGNDYGYEKLFSRQIQALGQAGDIFIGYSTSGRSPNVLAAFTEARARGMLCVGLTGNRGGPMLELCDFVLATPSARSYRTSRRSSSGAWASRPKTVSRPRCRGWVKRMGALALLCGGLAGPLFHLITPEWSVVVAGVVGGTLAFGINKLIGKNGGAQRE